MAHKWNLAADLVGIDPAGPCTTVRARNGAIVRAAPDPVGGPVLDERTGAVETAADIPSRYAVGQTAVGLRVHPYVGGPLPADRILSGRRVGSSAAGAPPTVEDAADDHVSSWAPAEGV